MEQKKELSEIFSFLESLKIHFLILMESNRIKRKMSDLSQNTHVIYIYSCKESLAGVLKDIC